MQREFYPIIKDFKNMGLTDYQIEQLIAYENEKHCFHDQWMTVRHFSEPHSIFFLDIKNTLYHSKGHGGSGALGRAGDSLQIFMRDVLALGSILDKTLGQYLTMHNYILCENESVKIDYDFPKDSREATYAFDIPRSKIKDSFTGKMKYYVDNSPYKVVFISSDSVETQKRIVLFFLMIYRIYFRSIKEYIDKAQWLDSSEILRLEKIFESSGYNYDEFVRRVPEYSNAFDIEIKMKIEKILENITFLSTRGLNSSKAELMKSFLIQYNIKHGLSFDDYNIFACGDDFLADGPMIKLAFKLGGYGCINDGTLHYDSYGETLRAELYNYFNIETRVPLTSYGFADFYNKVLDRLSLARTWDLAETMAEINDPEKRLVLNRFKKTNHYITIKRND